MVKFVLERSTGIYQPAAVKKKKEREREREITEVCIIVIFGDESKKINKKKHVPISP